jgi:hypothetical protein
LLSLLVTTTCSLIRFALLLFHFYFLTVF